MSQINVDTIRSRLGRAPSLDQGAVVTGVVTATSFSGNGSSLDNIDTNNIAISGIATVGTAVTINSSGINVTGIVTATGLVYGTTNVSTELATKASTGKAIAMAMVFG